MPTIRFDKLIDHYLPTHEGPHFHPSATQELTSVLGDDGYLHIDQQVELEDYGVPYKQLAFISQSDDGSSNQKVYYLNLIGEQDSVADLEIVPDMAASNARALHVLAGHVLVFRTSYPYNPQTLKKMSVRLRVGTPGDIRIGLVGISDKAYIKPDTNSGFPTTTNSNDMYEIVVGASNVGDIDATYKMFTGYFKGLSATPLTQSFPSPDPNTPYALLDDAGHTKTTTDVAMAIKCISGDYYIDSLELFDVENTIADIPEGASVLSTISDITDDGHLTPVEKRWLKPQYDTIVAEYTAIYNQATALSISTTAYANAYTALTSEISTGNYLALGNYFTDMTTTATFKDGLIGGLTYAVAFRNLWATYWDDKSAIQTAISNIIDEHVVVSNKFDLKVNYSAINTAADGHVFLSGVGSNGALNNDVGYVYHPTTKALVTLPAAGVDCNAFLANLDGNSMRLTVFYNTVTASYAIGTFSPADVAYVDAGSNPVVITNLIIIGYVLLQGTSVIGATPLITARSIAQGLQDERTYILEYLNVPTAEEFKERAEAMGFENVFTSLAAYDAFIHNLYVKNLKVGTGDSEEVEFDCIQFNGTSSYTETPAFAIAGADRTFEMWIKPEIIDSYTGLFIQNTNANDASSNNIVGFQGYPGSSNEITLAIGSSSAYYITGKVALPIGVWTHLAGVIEGGVSAKVYLNGNLLINETISISPSTGSLKVIMGRIMDKYLDGMCRDFRIWNTVRTQQQIQDNMLADLVGNESGLIALWKANEMTGTTLTDSVGSNDATATGVSWVTDIGIVSGTGFKFTAVQDDGTGKSRFDVYYNGERVFEANPQNGKVYFGNNFWYDPADGAIHTPNNKTVIKADGTIEAVDGEFSGMVNANEGVFKGSIDSPAFSSLPSSSGTTDDTSLTSSKDYQANTMCSYCVATLTTNHFYSCSVSIDSAVAYIRWAGDSTNTNVYFYNSSFAIIAEMRRAYGTFGWSYYSDYAGSALTVSVSYGAGDVFKFKSIPTDSLGLESGQVWSDGGTLKIIP